MNDLLELVPVFPARKVLFREHESTNWEEYYFAIHCKKALLSPARSNQPLHVMLITNIEGFRSTEVIAFDLFSAIASAMLTAESLMIMLQRTGEIQLREGASFDLASDSVFFGSRVDRLRDVLGGNVAEPTDT